MKSLTVWILQTGEPLHIDKGNPRPMRAMNLANVLVNKGHKVIIWSSAFYHTEKRQRSLEYVSINVSLSLEIRLIPSPGYKHHIGVSRLWDHFIIANNLKKILYHESSAPDVAFIGYPPIEVAAVMVSWLAEQKVPCILDIKDQWPNIFVDAFPKSIRFLGRIGSAPYYHTAKYAMREATCLSAMADSFLSWALDFSGRQRNAKDRVFPLTSPDDKVTFEELEDANLWLNKKGIINNGKPRLCFIGTHSRAFDFNPVLEAAQYFADEENPCEFVICGDGECSPIWRKMMKNLPNVIFTGWVNQSQIKALTSISLGAIAPYKCTDDFVMSIPNKIIDALCVGIPVITPLTGEVAKLIDQYNIGLRYDTDSGKTLIQCIEILISKPVQSQIMSNNALKLYKDTFSFNKVYGELVKHLEILSQLNIVDY